MRKKIVKQSARSGLKPAAKRSRNDSLLIELRTEELPPKSLERLANAFADGINGELRERGYLDDDSSKQVFATPRRLAVLISGVHAKQPDRMVERKGPALAAGVDAAGKPTPALLGFAKSCGVAVGKLQKRSGDKGEYFIYGFKQKGEALAKHLAAIVDASLKKLPVAKTMRWGSGEAQFVRPVHGLIMLHGKKTVPGEVLGLKSGKTTLGHRFLSKGTLIIGAATDYEKILEKKGSVIADFQRRRQMIGKQLDAAAGKVGKGTVWSLGNHDSLLNEVASIVEFPVVYTGEFSKDFLQVPRECLIISMQQHQKYFPLAARGKLLAQFLFVSNNRSKSPKQVIHGNERVLRARLSDAKFFFDQDRKAPLAERVPRLANVVYHNKLGSQLQRVERIQKLAGEISAKLNAPDIEVVRRAAYLSKADLLTEMVGEFPELQGIMGNYYSVHDGEKPAVAEAILEHYQPRYAGDDLPRNVTSVCVALADKLDTLSGIYGIGLIPTGDKDPFGLRRQALGVIRMLIEHAGMLPSVDIMDLLRLSKSHFPRGVVADSVADDLYGFMLERLKPYLREKGFLPDEIDAVLSLNPTHMDQVIRRLQALQAFRRLPEAAALAAANKRIHNILKQAGADDMVMHAVDSSLLVEPVEKALLDHVALLSARVLPLFASGNYVDALMQLAHLRDHVDAFFDKVMVMADDKDLRRSRLSLLGQIRGLFLQAADISRLQG